jgi:FlaA1/EpsC-like NDP-sugar epimerase
MVPQRWRSAAVFAFDLLSVATAWFIAHLLSVDFSLTPAASQQALFALVLLLPVQALVFRMVGLYRGIWAYSSVPDLERLLKAIVFSGLLLASGIGLFHSSAQIPRAVLVLYPLLLLVFMGGGRAIYRMWKDHYLFSATGDGGRPVIILGAGRAAVGLVQELAYSKQWRIVGLLDDDVSKQGREISGHRVLGPIDDLEVWSRRLDARQAILAIPSAKQAAHQRLIDICVDAGVRAYTIPTTEQLLSGLDRLDHVRPLDLKDLLGRSPVNIDLAEIKALISMRSVMVTGAGGSIGSELCRQISRLNPGQLILFDNNEYALYLLHEELTNHFPDVQVVPLAGDVKDAPWVAEAIRRYAPSVVFHAAAYKHVPLMEEVNAWQAVRNNALGTYVVASASLRAEVPEFVLVSTDKAVNPTNVMGASKRLAEMICQTLQGTQTATRFEIVRFGNVLGSTGSVIPKFRAQIENGGPITVTHPEITRYFMSIPEASQLVLQAAAMGEGGEIFVLDMGQPLRIADVAKTMIRLAGYREDEIRIIFTGLRAGEKLFEEPLSQEEQMRPTHHPKLHIAKARSVPAGWLEDVLDWLKSSVPKTDAEVRRDLRRWVSEYQPAKPPTLRSVTSAKEI